MNKYAWQQELRIKTRLRMIKIGAQIVNEQGEYALSLSSVARACGVSRQAVHKVFGSVENMRRLVLMFKAESDKAR